MKVLVTGAGGFSARYLVDMLRARGNEVICTDISGDAPGLIKLDCANADAVGALYREKKPDRIYHLAGSFTNDYDTDYTTNVLTTRVLFETMLTAGPQTRILVVGSAAEYGNVEKNPVSEDSPLKPCTVYGLTKAFQTQMMQYYVAQKGIDAVMARPFNLYGNGASRNLFIGRVYHEIERYKRGECTRIVVGSLQSRRDYLAVDHAVRDYQTIMEKGERGAIYNVGSGKSTKMIDFLEALLTENDVPRDVVEEKTDSQQSRFDIPDIFADISKLKRLKNK